jgi:hypothetical protein
VDDRIDVAIRNGRLDDRNIIARQLAPMQLIVCGSAKYFAHHPKPQTPDDLSQHRCINFRLAETGRIFPWEFERDGRRFNRSVTCLAALKGMGLAQIGSYQAGAADQRGAVDPGANRLYRATTRALYLLSRPVAPAGPHQGLCRFRLQQNTRERSPPLSLAPKRSSLGQQTFANT